MLKAWEENDEQPLGTADCDPCETCKEEYYYVNGNKNMQPFITKYTHQWDTNTYHRKTKKRSNLWLEKYSQ